MKRLCMSSMLLGVMLSGSVFSASHTIAPLSNVVTTPVGGVRPGTIQLPIITWGADIRTIYANGSSLSTTPDSIFSQQGLNIDLKREDVFTKQLENYLSGKSPYLRGTLGMINQAADLLSQDPRTVPVVIYQLSESAGGDALVVKSSVRKCNDLQGKTIALQAYGPHVDYLAQLLSDCGLSMNSVKFRWVKDLTGSADSPAQQLHQGDVDAAMVIIPDALALTSGGAVGTGSEDSVKGARVLLSTKSANRVIADVYAVRTDYFKSNRADVEKLVYALHKAQESVADVMKKGNAHSDYKKLMRASAKILLDSENAVGDTEGLYRDAEHVSFALNKQFFTDTNYPRNFTRRNTLIQKGLQEIGLTTGRVKLAHAGWDYASLQKGLINTQIVAREKFDTGKATEFITKRQGKGGTSDTAVIEFEVNFKPNQNDFSEELYKERFDKVLDLAATYGGALITVEGHSDPMGYLRQRKQGSDAIVLKRVEQAAKNLSLTRAVSVRDAIVSYAQKRKITLDPSQFVVVGHGITSPKTGMCGRDPCVPKTEDEWLSNMRVQFKLIPIEAEDSSFKPL